MHTTPWIVAACIAQSSTAQAPLAWTADDHGVTVPLSASLLGDDLSTLVFRGDMSLSLLPTDDGVSMRLILPPGSTYAVLGAKRRGEPLGRIGLTLGAGGRVQAQDLEAPSPDIDRDGEVTGDDMPLLLGAVWRRCFCREDTNRDGRVDTGDIRLVGDALHLTIDQWRARWSEWASW